VKNPVVEIGIARDYDYYFCLLKGINVETKILV